MPSPTHITTYASDACALLTSRYRLPRPDAPVPPPPTPVEDEVAHWQDGTDAAYQITGTGSDGIELVTIPTLTGARTWTMPTAPSDGMIVGIYDLSGALVDSGDTLSLTTTGGTDHFFFDGADKGTTWQIPASLYKNGTVNLVRRAGTNSWNVAL